MAIDRTKMFSSVFPIGIALLLSLEVAINVQGVIFVANVGEDVTLPCNPDKSTAPGNLYWRKDNEYMAAMDYNYPTGGLYSQYELDTRLSVSYKDDMGNQSFMLYIRDANFTDSVKYTCLRTEPRYSKVYDLRVIGCSPCLVNLSQGFDPEGVDINCYLDHFNSSKHMPLNVTLNSKETKTAVIEGSSLTLTTGGKMLYDDIQVQFNPYNGATGNITCIVPAQALPPSPSSFTTATTTESYGSSSKNSDSTILIVVISGTLFVFILIAIFLVLSFKKTRHSNQIKSSKTETYGSNVHNAAMDESGPCYESIKGTCKGEPLEGNTLLDSSDAIVEDGSCRSSDLDTVLYTLPDKTGVINRVAKSKVMSDSTNSASTHDDERKGSPLQKSNQYEQVDIAGPRAGDDGTKISLYAMPDGEGISAGNTVKATPGSNDVLKIPVYAIPDKGQGPTGNTGTQASREDKGEEIPLYASADKGSGSSWNTPRAALGQNDSREKPLFSTPEKQEGSAGNSAKATSEQKDDGEIPLYAMPDRGRGSTANKINAPLGPEARNDGMDIPLYAMPDRGSGSTVNTMKASPGSEARNGGMEIPLYAMPDRGSGSTVNTMKASQGSEARNDGMEIPLYAMPDKGSGSTVNNMKASPGSEARNDGMEIPLHAMPENILGATGKNVSFIPGEAEVDSGVIPLSAITDKGPARKSIKPALDVLYAEVN